MNQVNHQYYQERLSAFADNELPPDERARVEAHLMDCPDCQKRLADLRKLEELVAEQSTLNDSDYWERSALKIEAALPEQGKVVDLNVERKRHSALWWRLPAIAASIVFLVYIGIHEEDILKQETPESPQPAPSLQQATPDKAVELAPDTSARFEKPKDKVSVDHTAADEAARRKVKTVAADTSRPAEVRTKVAEPKIKAEQPSLAPSLAPAPPREDIETILNEEPVAIPDALEDNSLQLLREKSGAAAESTEEDAAAGPESLLREAPMVAAASMEQLASLRIRRDSLESIVSELGKSAKRSKVGGVQSLTEQGKESGVDLKGMLSSKSAKDQKTQMEKTEAALVETWFGICRQSTDSVEINQGVKYLNEVALKGTGDNRQLAARYLKELGRQ